MVGSVKFMVHLVNVPSRMVTSVGNLVHFILKNDLVVVLVNGLSGEHSESGSGQWSL